MLKALTDAVRVLQEVGSSSVDSWYAKTGVTGLIIMTILELPVLILIVAAIFGNPIKWKMKGLFIALLVLLFGGFIGGIFILSAFLRLIS